MRLAAEHAAEQETRPVEVDATDSIFAGLAALAAYDGARGAAENAGAMADAASAVATGEVTRASRDVRVAGLAIGSGDWLGLADGEPVAGGDDFAEVAASVARLLAEPRALLTILTGAEPPPLDGLLERLESTHPELEVEVREGGQPHYPLLLGAE